MGSNISTTGSYARLQRTGYGPMDRDDTSHFQRRMNSTGIETVSDIVLIDSTAYEKDTIDIDMDTRREIPISIAVIWNSSPTHPSADIDNNKQSRYP